MVDQFTSRLILGNRRTKYVLGLRKADDICLSGIPRSLLSSTLMFAVRLSLVNNLD